MIDTKKIEKTDLPVNNNKEKIKSKAKIMDEPVSDNLHDMKKRLAVTKDPQQQKIILEHIRKHFGNDVTEKVISELRLQKSEKKKG